MSRSVYEQNGLVITVEQSGDVASIVWRGVSDRPFPGQFLNPLIREWAQNLKDCSVTVDMRQLEFMNSATVISFLTLVRSLAGNGKLIVVLFSGARWQRSHRSCMTAAMRNLKNVRVESVGPPDAESPDGPS
jgi:hypothetical protein